VGFFLVVFGLIIRRVVRRGDWLTVLQLYAVFSYMDLDSTRT
jgi:hypothetical protein